MATKILVCGDRNWSDYDIIRDHLSCLNSSTIIITGGCRGADKLAEKAAIELGLEVQVFEAQWDLYGKSAGPIRNIAMLDQQPSLVLAFHDDIEHSKGTAHTVREARKRKIPIKIVTH
jgi:hypothetical protein